MKEHKKTYFINIFLYRQPFGEYFQLKVIKRCRFIIVFIVSLNRKYRQSRYESTRLTVE